MTAYGQEFCGRVDGTFARQPAAPAIAGYPVRCPAWRHRPDRRPSVRRDGRPLAPRTGRPTALATHCRAVPTV